MKAPLEAAECHGALKCSGTPPTRSRCSLEATRDAISQSGRFDESSAREETESWELEMCTHMPRQLRCMQKENSVVVWVST